MLIILHVHKIVQNLFLICITKLLLPALPPFLSFPKRMITAHVDPGRYSRSSTQAFYIIKTLPQHVILMLGSTGNSYLITITPSCITCNCPDRSQSCKHILFLVATCGFLPRRVSHVSFSRRSILLQLHAAPPSPRLEASFLDNHTLKLCSAHRYPRCFFCATPPTSQPAHTLVLCSRCGFLCHESCLHDFMNDGDNCISFQNLCPRCGRTSVKLFSHISSGYRNFASILQHRGYHCLNHPTNAPPTTNNTPGVTETHLDNNLPNFRINQQGEPSLDINLQDV